MAAEIFVRRDVQGRVGHASMRPRRMAAEIVISLLSRGPERLCFNEAAANGRGNLWALKRMPARANELQ